MSFSSRLQAQLPAYVRIEYVGAQGFLKSRVHSESWTGGVNSSLQTSTFYQTLTVT